MKISFDFDSTLDRGDVQHFAKQLIKKGYEAWVVTSRVPDHKAPSTGWNNDLWFVCRHLEIPKERAVFTSYSSKHEFFWTRDFLFHLDDDVDELKAIRVHCQTKAIHVEEPDWREQILTCLKEVAPIGEGCLCQGCGTRYKVDLSVPDELWGKIRPEGKDKGAGMLCGPCIMTRIEQLGEHGHYEILGEE